MLQTLTLQQKQQQKQQSALFSEQCK